VAKERIPASHTMGRLQVQQPADHAKGLQLNLLQKIFQDSLINKRQSQLPALLQELLQQFHRPTVEDHMQQLGPLEWAHTGQMIGEHNALLGQAFTAMSKFLKLYETGSEGWHAAIHGHTSGRTFPSTEIERMELKRLQIFTVSQLFEEQDYAQISNQDNAELFDRLQQLSQTMYDKLS